MAIGAISDFEINNLVRRELVVRRLDTSTLKFGSSGGVVYVNGTIKFIGTEVTINEMPKYLYLLEQSIRGIRGVRNVKMEFDGWIKNKAGKWMRDKDEEKRKREESSPSAVPNAAAPIEKVIPVAKAETRNEDEQDQSCEVNSFPCRSCGYWVIKGVDFCENCGNRNVVKKLRSTIIVCNDCNFKSIKPINGECPDCGGTLEQRPAEYYAAKCKKCGFVKKWILNFCPECGFDLSMNEEPETTYKDEPEEENVIEEKEITLKDRVRMLLEQEKEKSIQKKGKKEHEINDILKKI